MNQWIQYSKEVCLNKGIHYEISQLNFATTFIRRPSQIMNYVARGQEFRYFAAWPPIEWMAQLMHNTKSIYTESDFSNLNLATAK